MLSFLKRFLPEIGWALCLALALALARSDAAGPAGGLRSALDEWAAPVQRLIARSRALSDSALHGWRDLDAVAAENRRLTAAQREAALQAQEIQALRAENRRLETALHLAGQLPLKTRGVRLLQLQTTLNEHVMWIGGEGLSGLVGGHALATGDGIAGRTLECGATKCRAMRLTDPLSGISLIDERSRLLISAEGNGTPLLTLRGISTGDDIRSGDLMLSSGLDGIYPRGLTVGRVTHYKPEGEAGPEGELRPAVELGNGLTLLVIE